MKAKITFLLQLCLVASLSNVTAQNLLEPRLERQFNLAVYRMLDSYERCSSVDSREDRQEFINLFTSPELPIFNDLMGLYYGSDISVKEYADLFQKQAIAKKIVIKNVRHSEIVDGGETFDMAIDFDKFMEYSSTCGVYLSPTSYYGKNLSLHAVFSMNKESGTVKISQLTGELPSSVPVFPERYEVLQKTAETAMFDDQLTLDGNKIRYNSFDQAYLPVNSTLVFRDVDVTMRLLREGDCGLMRTKYTQRRWRIKPNVEFALGDFYTLSNAPGDINAKGSATQFGVDFGYAFPSKGKIKLALFIGAALSSSKIIFSMDRYNYQYSASGLADVDNDTYLRCYELVDLKQELKSSDLVIPLYLESEFRFHKYFSLFLQVGAKGYVPITNSASSSAEAHIYGIYPQYQDLRLEESWLNGFGKHSLNSEYLANSTLNTKLVVDGFVGAGARILLYGPISLDLGLRYQASFMNYIENHNSLVNMSSMPNPDNSFSSYTVLGGEKVRNLFRTISSTKHSSLQFNVGLTFKF